MWELADPTEHRWGRRRQKVLQKETGEHEGGLILGTYRGFLQGRGRERWDEWIMDALRGRRRGRWMAEAGTHRFSDTDGQNGQLTASTLSAPCAGILPFEGPDRLTLRHLQNGSASSSSQAAPALARRPGVITRAQRSGG